MIFDEKELCRLAFCVSIEENAGATLLSGADCTVVLVSSGRAAVTANSEPVLLTAGQFCLLRGEAEVTPATACHIVCVGVNGIAAQFAAKKLAQPVQADGRTCPLTAQLVAEISGGMTVSSQCYALLCAVAGADAETPRLPTLVADAILAMRRNYAGLYGVEELSSQLGVSKSHLVRVFSAEMGVPPGQYLTQVRIHAAKLLLRHREYPLDVVATLCGFSGANYLCKVFKKETGLTPNTYRAQNAAPAENAAFTEAESAIYM